MAILTYTYVTLLQALKDMLEDEDAEFDAFGPTIIATGEQRLADDLNLHLFDGEDSGTFSNGNGQIDRPSDAIDVQSIHYVDSSGDFRFVEERTLEFCRAYTPNFSSTGAPKYWAPQGETTIRLVPAPDADLLYTIVSRKRPTGLSPAQATSWFGTHAAVALFFACLVVSEQFDIADERLEMWNGEYEKAKNSVLPLVAKLRRTEYAASQFANTTSPPGH